MYIKLKPPPDIKTKNDREVGDVEQCFKARKLKMGVRKRQQFDKFVRRAVDSWEEATGPMRTELRELNELLEGRKEEVDFPYGVGNSSSIDIRYAAAKARTLRAQFIRSVFSDPNLFVSELLPGANREGTDNVAEQAVNWTASKETNGVDALKDTPIPIYRDGTGLVFGEWERRIESGIDYRAYENAEQFQGDYPDASAAGVDQGTYDSILEELSMPDSEVHVEFETDFVAQNGPVYSNFPLAKFIWYPLFPQSLRTTDIFGYHFRQSASQFDMLVKYGFYDYDVAETVTKKSGSYSMADDEWDHSRDEIEGIDTADMENVSYKIAKLVVAFDLNNDKVAERYMVHWDMESKKSLRIERYGMWRNVPCIIPFRFIRRDSRWLGDSLLKDGKGLFQELNALHRHRSNVRRLTDSVTMIIPKALKEDVDLGAEYAEFRPGMTMWVPNDLPPEKYPRQFQIFNTSRTNDSVDEESMVVRYLDGLFGISEGQSGRETPSDPAAPAAKTAMLLQRADFRIEDLIEEWCRTIPEWVELHIALYYQNAKAKLKYMSHQGETLKESEIATSLLADPRRRFVLKKSKQTLSPEMEMNKLMALVAVAFQLQVPMKLKPEMVIDIWNDYVTASRIDLPERFQIQKGAQGTFSMGGQQVGMPQIQQMMGSMLAEAQLKKATNGTKGKTGAAR